MSLAQTEIVHKELKDDIMKSSDSPWSDDVLAKKKDVMVKKKGGLPTKP